MESKTIFLRILIGSIADRSKKEWNYIEYLINFCKFKQIVKSNWTKKKGNIQDQLVDTVKLRFYLTFPSFFFYSLFHLSFSILVSIPYEKSSHGIFIIVTKTIKKI